MGRLNGALKWDDGGMLRWDDGGALKWDDSGTHKWDDGWTTVGRSSGTMVGRWWDDRINILESFKCHNNPDLMRFLSFY